jgi:hypothetical protein
MMGRPVYTEVAGRQYNKKQFSERWKLIVSSHEVGVLLSGEDKMFMLGVCEKMERFRKILERPGASEFRVVKKTFNGKRVKGIALVTPNSRYEVWVGKAYTMGKIFPRTYVPDPAKVNRRNVIKALRDVIQPQIDVYRKSVSRQGLVKSSLTGKPVLGAYHVDHVYPFIRLVEEWCRDNSLDLENIPVKCMGVGCRLESVELSENWFDYHALNAQYQVLDARENIIKGDKYYGSSS